MRIADEIAKVEGRPPPVGTVDISLYRDDAATALPNPKIGPSDIPFGACRTTGAQREFGLRRFVIAGAASFQSHRTSSAVPSKWTRVHASTFG